MSEKDRLRDFMESLGKEIDEESARRMTPEQQKLHDISRRLLVLERDLRAPGVARTADDRVARLIEELAREKF